MESKQKLICEKCNIPMEPMEARFRYLKRDFKHKVLRCPDCGQIYIPKDLAKGRMKEVETALEDK